MFFLLPPELLELTLSFLEPTELKWLFLLDKLFKPHSGIRASDPYTVVRHLALRNYYRSLVISSFPEVNNFDVQELRYLVHNDVIIHPKEILFVVASDAIDFIHSFGAYSKWLNVYSLEISMELVFDDENDTGRVYDIFELLAKSGCKIGNLKVRKDKLISHTRNKEMEDIHQKFSTIDQDSYFQSQLGSIQLHFFDSSLLMNHLNLYKTTLMCDSLTSLNLAYNTLSDLSQIQFPSSLIELDLSNNYLTSLSSFKWTDLTNLKVLNLANNNLMSVDFRENVPALLNTYSLTHLNLSGNNFMESNLNSRFLVGLEEIDLSRNRLSQLAKFPPTLLKIDLTGNCMRSFFEQLNGTIFPKNLEELNISFCRIDYFGRDSRKMAAKLLKLEQLDKLRVLRLCGDHRDHQLAKEVRRELMQI